MLLSDVRGLVFDDPIVALRSRVSSDTYRFSPLTLQDYLGRLPSCHRRRWPIGHVRCVNALRDTQQGAFPCLGPIHSP